MKQLTVIKIKLHMRALPSYALVLGIATLAAYLSNRIVETIVLIVSFLMLRYKFEKTYHSESAVVCLAITCSIIILTVPFLVSCSVSLLFPIFIGLAVDLGAWLAKDYIDLKGRKTKASVSLLEMTDLEFIKYCQHKNLQDDEIKIAELCVRQNLKGKEFYSAIGYSEAQAKRKRKTIIEKLNR